MAVAFRSTSSFVTPQTTSAAVPAPAGVAADDILLMFVMGIASGGWTINTPSGWTLLQHVQPGGGFYKAAAFWKRSAGSEPSTYTVAASGGQNVYWCVIVVAYSGASTTAAINASAHTNDASGTGATVTTPTVTSTVANCMIVRAAVRSVTGTATPPASHTERADVQETNWGSQATSAEIFQASAGAAGTAAFTFSVSTPHIYHASTIALAPAAAPAATFVPQIIIS